MNVNLENLSSGSTLCVERSGGKVWRRCECVKVETKHCHHNAILYCYLSAIMCWGWGWGNGSLIRWSGIWSKKQTFHWVLCKNVNAVIPVRTWLWGKYAWIFEWESVSYIRDQCQAFLLLVSHKRIIISLTVPVCPFLLLSTLTLHHVLSIEGCVAVYSCFL